MNKLIFSVLFLLFNLLCYSQSIRTIKAFEKQGDSLILSSRTEFDRNGNLIGEINYGRYDSLLGTQRNYHRYIKYEKGRRKSSSRCENFVARDTCVIRQYKIFSYNPKTETEREIIYESDSLIRLIRDVREEPGRRITKVHTWEFHPVKEPDYDNVMVLTDTSYLDKRGRVVKSVRWNSDFKEPVMETTHYSDSGFIQKTVVGDRVREMTYPYHPHKIQQELDQKDIDYQTYDNVEYELEYY